jgi:hypothetical protein
MRRGHADSANALPVPVNGAGEAAWRYLARFIDDPFGLGSVL